MNCLCGNSVGELFRKPELAVVYDPFTQCVADCKRWPQFYIPLPVCPVFGLLYKLARVSCYSIYHVACSKNWLHFLIPLLSVGLLPPAHSLCPSAIVCG